VVRVKRAASPAVAWHDVECGAYTADLPLWRELAEAHGPDVLDLGAGTGRVAIDLARRRHSVTAVDSDVELGDELVARSDAFDLDVRVHTGDVREVRLGCGYGLVLAPMQLIQLMGGPEGRLALLATIRSHLAPGGLAALAVAVPGAPLSEDAPMPLPDVLELDRWVFSSTPLTVRSVPEGSEIVRHRQMVSPDGVLTESESVIVLEACTSDLVEQESKAAGLALAGRREIAETADHVGSTVVLLEAIS
jgi:SAM-dependent methyltransferase